MAVIDLSKLPELPRLSTILLMKYYSKKRPNPDWKAMKRDRSANWVLSML